MDLLGKPALGAALLYVGGAVAAFLAIEVAAYGGFRVLLATGPPPPMAAWGNAHFLSAGATVVAVWGADHLLQGQLAGWLVAGFLATSIYLSLNAVQTSLASRWGFTST
jgi:hypothetical protein